MKKESTIVFTGDIGFDKYMDGKWADDSLLSDGIKDFIKQSDHVVINVEGPIAESVTAPDRNGVLQLKHTMHPGAVEMFNSIGADIWNICNNHIMDAGEEGMKSTLEYA